MSPTSKRPRPYDVIIVGAGSAGAATALQCARRGLRTLCLDRRAEGRAGAQWVNGVPAWAFSEAGIDPPRAPELRGEAGPFHLVAGWGPTRLTLRDHCVLEVDMRALVARLQGRARQAGAELRFETCVTGLEGGLLHTTGGPLRGEIIVDASGLGGAGLAPTPPVNPAELCAAAQGVFGVADPAAASAWLEDQGAGPGEAVCFSAIAGGYSIVNLRLHGDEVSILTGSVPALGHASGRALLAEALARFPWIGARRFGGSGPIPLRRPATHLVHGRVALIGDAASQVFSTHGSGVAVQLMASKLLAEVASRGLPLITYQTRWQRRWGGLLAASDLFRRFTSTQSPHDIARLIRSGTLNPEVVRDGLSQRWPRPDLRKLARVLRGALRDPGALGHIAPVIAKMALAPPLWRGFPADPARIDAWERRVQRWLG